MKIDRLLAEHQLLVTTAESCTGGLVASALVDIPGISDYGVVSEQTAQEMAEGAAKQAHAGCAVATTGVAGPGGGTLKTPVGTVCFGCFVQGKIFSGTEHFTGTRSEIRHAAAAYAIAFLERCIIKTYGGTLCES